MKILELRFKNLNSLYGEWLIDFTLPDYLSHGIFALTGPTGSGKSTILDAICLALYGATPRLGKITKKSNEIMSRQTGECYAEVVFASQAGTFRCHWEQRRARKQPNGRLQDQEHHIADAHTGKPIETKKSRVGAVIEETTGMDFDRFTRSMLLAQGGFDTFLKADVEHKSKILEQITGTAIYSDISRAVHERQRKEQDKLNLLKAQVSGISILNQEQEHEIQTTLAARQKQEAELVTTCTQTGKAITWLSAITELKKEILSLQDEAARLKADTDAFKPERTRLELALKAADIDGRYAALTALRHQQTMDQASLQKAQAELPKLEAAAKSQSATLQAAEKRTWQAKKNVQEAAPLIQKIRSLDQKVEAQTKTLSEGNAACTRETATIAANKKARIKKEKQQAAARKTLEAVERYLKEHARDEWLISGLAGIEEQCSSLLARQQDISQKEADLTKAVTAVADCTKKLDAASRQYFLNKQKLTTARTKLQQGRDALSRLLNRKLLREYYTEKETLLREMAYIQKIMALEDQRTRLEDGKACPLCGSTTHPFAQGNVPVPDTIEHKIDSLTKLITKAEKQETAIKQLEQAETTARNNLDESEKLEMGAANDKKVAEKTCKDVKDALTKLQTGFDELKLAVSEKLQPLGMTDIPTTKVEALLASLTSRQKAWQEQIRQKTEMEQQIAGIISEVGRLDAVNDTLVKALSEKQDNLKRLKKELADNAAERKALYGDTNPDDEEKRLKTSLSHTEQAERQARELMFKMEQQLTAATTHRASLQKSIEQRAPELQQAATEFAGALVQAGFADEESFLRARLTVEERDLLASRARKLDHAETELGAKHKDRTMRLAAETAKKLTSQTLDELEPLRNELEASLQDVRDAIAGFQHTLRDNTAAKNRIKEHQSAIEAQKKECRRWEKLHGLIGSADGKKYRNFAQGLTFERMVQHANRQLTKMTDRYLLIRDNHHPLELSVIDQYQAGEIRSVSNLSGGESFLVSLTLALGLSNMASRKVRVDSLFLDEGFGSLDEDALDTALETLSDLQQDGKLIGIISHVSALKERIRTQIRITPNLGGRSVLSGPGCTKMKHYKNVVDLGGYSPIAHANHTV